MSFLLLDTDTSIFLLNQANPAAEQRLRSLRRGEVGIAAITLAELYYGAAHSSKREANEKRVEIFSRSLTVCPFEGGAARRYGSMREILTAKGGMIGIMDLLIASVALAKSATLVTHNIREFQRIPDLQVEDWFS